jgi:hypothetical protein
MFRRSGYRFADKNMRQSILSTACPDSKERDMLEIAFARLRRAEVWQG